MTTQAQVQGLGSFVRWAFTLEHPDDHVIVLKHENQKVAIFSQTGVTPDSLQRECARHLALHHHWSGCLWQRKEANNGS